MTRLIFSGLLALSASVQAQQVSLGPKSLSCHTVTLIESYQTIDLVKTASGANVLRVADVWIDTERGNPEFYSIVSFLPDQNDKEFVLEAKSNSKTNKFSRFTLILDKTSGLKEGQVRFWDNAGMFAPAQVFCH